jgi:ribosomal protection tetracycline resistance protein
MQMLPKLRAVGEEEPQLHIEWNENFKEIHVQVMGPVMIEVLQNIIKERFGIDVTFGEGSIVYKETITNKVEGIGHEINTD